MKTIVNVFLACLLLMSAAGCRKEDKLSPEELEHQRLLKYYVKFKVDAQTIAYRYNDDAFSAAILKTPDQNGNYGALASFYKTSEVISRNWIGILLGDKSPITARKIYGTPNSTVTGAVKSPVFLLGYKDGEGNDYTASIFDILPGPYDAQVVFTSISNSEIKGSFSGRLHHFKDGKVIKTINVTAGSFYMPATM